MIQGEWKNCVITVGTSATLSAEVNLGRAYDTLLVVIPTITAASVSVRVAEKTGGTFQDLYITSTNDGDDKQPITTSGTGGITWVVPLGGFQFIKLLSSQNQASNRTFRVCGVRR
ncbi:MAG: hypothetical protein FJ006_12255 [Chloroflexi bacterium]|nr:hypothetical protein [Chloroflexota bacterium]